MVRGLMIRLLSALLMIVAAARLPARAETQWQPAHTYVMVCSITAWPASAGLPGGAGSPQRAVTLVPA